MSDEESATNGLFSTLTADKELPLKDDIKDLCPEPTGPIIRGDNSELEVEPTEVEPLFNASAMENKSEEQNSNEKELDGEESCSCWKSKYNWRHLLPCSCCCKR